MTKEAEVWTQDSIKLKLSEQMIIQENCISNKFP